jgi:serine/threonine protein kinase
MTGPQNAAGVSKCRGCGRSIHVSVDPRRPPNTDALCPTCFALVGSSEQVGTSPADTLAPGLFGEKVGDPPPTMPIDLNSLGRVPPMSAPPMPAPTLPLPGSSKYRTVPPAGAPIPQVPPRSGADRPVPPAGAGSPPAAPPGAGSRVGRAGPQGGAGGAPPAAPAGSNLRTAAAPPRSAVAQNPAGAAPGAAPGTSPTRAAPAATRAPAPPGSRGNPAAAPAPAADIPPPPQGLNPDDWWVGQVIGNYKVESMLGRGGMGIVYKAVDVNLRRPVAVKAMIAVSERSQARFLREAHLAAVLNHPNIVTVYNFGEHKTIPYMVVELMTGGSLEERVKKGPPVSPREAARMIAGASRGLHLAHKNRVLHRDIKPGNVLLAEDGTPKLADFGLARSLDESIRLTRTGMLLGTLQYVAPELFRGEQASGGTDVYALGCTLYFLLTGKHPFDNGSVGAIVSAKMNTRALDVRAERPDVPADIAHVLARSTCDDPSQRYDTAEAFAADLEAVVAAGATGRSVSSANLSPLPDPDAAPFPPPGRSNAMRGRTGMMSPPPPAAFVPEPLPRPTLSQTGQLVLWAAVGFGVSAVAVAMVLWLLLRR